MKHSVEKTHAIIWLTLAAALGSAPALGYVGPGAGLTLLSALWGLVVAVLAAGAFLVLWPLRRWRRRRQTMESGADVLEGTPDEEMEGTATMRRSSRQGADGEE